MCNSDDKGFMREPPKLSRDNFSTWKHRMLAYLQCMDTDHRVDPIKKGRFVPHSTSYENTAAGTIWRRNPLPENSWSKEDFRKVAVDTNAKYILMESIPDDILLSVIHCDSAKDIWDALGVLFEGTAETRESKRTLLIQQYELFDSKPGESVTETYIRFNCLLNDLKQYGTTFDNKDIVDKFLQTLPSSAWSKLSMAVKLSKDLNSMPMPLEVRLIKDLTSMSLEALYGKFLVHELKTIQKEIAQNKGKNNYLDLVSTSSTMVGTGVGNEKTESDREEVSSDESDLEELGETMVKLALKYRKLARKRIFKGASDNKKSDKPESAGNNKHRVEMATSLLGAEAKATDIE